MADGNLDADGDGFIAVHVVVQVVKGLVVALGEGEDAVAGFEFGHVQKLIEGVGEDMGVVLGSEFLHAAGAEHEGTHVGADVAFPVVRVADVEEDNI